MARYAIMLAIFVVGTAVGLGASWWLRHPTVPAQAVAAKNTQLGSPARGMAPRDAGRAVAVRGISPSELPYDGKPPPANEEPANLPDGVPAASLQERLPAEHAAVDPVPPDYRQSSGASAEEKIGVPEGEGAASSATAALIDKEDGSDRPTPRAAEAAPKAAKQPAKETSSVHAKAKEWDADDAKAAKKQPPSRLAKDREIERIKREAEKELQRKLEVSRAADEARARRQTADASRSKRHAELSGESKTAHVRKVLARCDRISNLFRREKCKWDLCANRWGKHGCPSYSRPVNTY